MLMLAE